MLIVIHSQVVYIYYGEGNTEFDTYLVLANGKIIGLPFADKIQEINTELIQMRS